MGALELRAHLILQLSANEHLREISDERELVNSFLCQFYDFISQYSNYPYFLPI